ncbi:MAG: hypothetical protein IJI20_03130 [Firmicutes bacterium]|nr:hypothetical protein [Bacillota bacterium]
MRAHRENRIAKKLHSRKGASITFGLLLFLVCAVAASIIIVAGTSAAGRLSGLADSEQRYFSVSSSARLIEDLVDGKTATVIEYNGNLYVGSGNKLKEATSTGSLKTLPDYLAYQMKQEVEGDQTLALNATGELSKAVENVSVTESIDGNNVVFSIVGSNSKNTKSNTVRLIFSTSKTQPKPVKIGGGTGTETTYTWDLKSSDLNANAAGD